jgi:peptidoglycan/LPS O-acetylase OafA/YrhL
VLAPDRLSGLSITTLNGASFLVLAALSLLFYEHARLMPKGADYLIVLIFFPLLVLGSIHSGTFLHRFLSLSVFRYLGDISYSIYLWHWPLGTLLAHAQIHLPGIHGPIWGIAFFAGLLPLSVLSFHYLEMPLRNLLKYRSWALDS